jgi:hypothetical protein
MKVLTVFACLALATAATAIPQRSSAADCLSCCDAPARWGPRHFTEDARIAINTRDGDVTLLLTDRLVAVQLSDRKLHRIDRELRDKREEQEDADNPLAEAISAAVIGTVRQLIRHSAEVSIREVRDVRYEDGELVFIDKHGEKLFNHIDVDDDDVMRGFAERDAQAFVHEFQRLKARSS